MTALSYSPASVADVKLQSASFDTNTNSLTLTMSDSTVLTVDLSSLAGGGEGEPVTGIIYREDTLPANDAPAGLYSIQTGSLRGLYVSTGSGALYLLHAYESDGPYPI